MALILFGLLQVSRLTAAREVLDYAASRGLRAKTVGFNRFMVYKTIRVGAIPNAGRLVTPPYTGGPTAEYNLERSRIPHYLAADNYGQLNAVLDYADWDTIQPGVPSDNGDGTLHLTVAQNVPLDDPFHRAYYASNAVELEGESYLDNHYTLYMNDEGR